MRLPEGSQTSSQEIDDIIVELVRSLARKAAREDHHADTMREDKEHEGCDLRPLLDRPAFHEPSRPRLVGLRATDGKATIRGGAQITTESAPSHSLGHITSSAFSPAVGEWIALALVARSHAVEGATLMARDPLRGQNVQVRVTALPHYDPKNERMKS